uniref:eCIS core domain-containing protein n=1 Tax=Herbidospora sakaeratensis TaxID=564415 RepID=UPI000781C4EE|nr:DUF4157 domain-containing protein [Herbidospora sakaeratensis]
MDHEKTAGQRLAVQAGALRARRTAAPGWLGPLARVLDRERAFPVPGDSPRRRTEVRVPPLGHDPAPSTPEWPEWPVRDPAPGRPGRPLRGDVRERLLPVVGPAIDRVRVHDDAHAARVAAAHAADAVTLGTEIFLGRPESARPESLALLAHEVWHATEPDRTGGAPHRATAEGRAGEERAALAVEHAHHAPASPRSPALPGWSPPAPASGAGTAGWTAAATPSPAASSPAARPMTARTDRPGVVPASSAAATLDPGTLRAMVREVLRGELREQGSRQLRADLAIELERGA